MELLRFAVRAELREAKVDQLDELLILAKEHILSLQVSMNNVEVMKVL